MVTPPDTYNSAGSITERKSLVSSKKKPPTRVNLGREREMRLLASRAKDDRTTASDANESKVNAALRPTLINPPTEASDVRFTTLSEFVKEILTEHPMETTNGIEKWAAVVDITDTLLVTKINEGYSIIGNMSVVFPTSTLVQSNASKKIAEVLQTEKAFLNVVKKLLP